MHYLMLMEWTSSISSKMVLKLGYDQTQIIFRLWKLAIVHLLPRLQMPKTASPVDPRSRHTQKTKNTIKQNKTLLGNPPFISPPSLVTHQSSEEHPFIQPARPKPTNTKPNPSLNSTSDKL